MLQADPLLAGGYNGVGISQGENPNKDDFYQINDDFYCPLCSTRCTPGGLLMRGLAQKCPEPPMVNLITYGAPSNGISIFQSKAKHFDEMIIDATMIAAVSFIGK